MLLERCKYISTFHFSSSLSRGVPDDLVKIFRNALVWLLVGSTFSFHWIWIIVAHCRWVWCHCHGYDVCSSSVANTFVHSQSAADYGYYAFSEVTHFDYCLFQKIKHSSVLPLVEQWEKYMAPNHSKFAAIEEDRFLVGTRVLSTFEKMGSSYLKKEFKWDCRKFLEDFVNCVLSTVAAMSVIGQGLICFCPPILVGGHNQAPMPFFDMLFDGLLENGWVRGA